MQIVSFLEHIRQWEGIRGPFLVVVPLSTLSHWRKEVETWTNMNVLIYHDSDPTSRGSDARRVMREEEWYFKKNKDNSPLTSTWYLKFNVMVTTYEVVSQDIEFLQNIKWHVMVIDEGHRIKNKDGLLFDRLTALETDRRFLLTGTPIQNNTKELWTLLNFLDTENFASEKEFTDKFGNLQEAAQVQTLQTELKPFILRRLKGTVEKNIPPKVENIIHVELTNVQKKYYKAIYEKNVDFLSEHGGLRNQLRNIQMELRKVCNHPWLVDGCEDAECESDQEDEYTTDKYMEKTINASGKLVLLDKLLKKLQNEGHRVLIFSQMTQVLTIIETYLKHSEYQFERIDGTVTGQNREAAIKRYNKKGSEKFVFLLTTGAGGVGINLTTADTVIIFDPAWNPQQDQQALARVHRIGQTKPVTVYKFVTRNTYESEMFFRASKKLGLDDAVLGRMATKGNGESSDKKDSKAEHAEIERALKLGAYGQLKDDSAERDQFHNSDINTILTNNATVVTQQDELNAEEEASKGSGGRVFKQMSFVADEKTEELVMNDPNFWDKFKSDLRKYSPDVLLSQLDDSDYNNTEEERETFFTRLGKQVDHQLELRKQGELVDSIELIGLMGYFIEIGAIRGFNEAQIDRAEEWNNELNKKQERKRKQVNHSETHTSSRRGLKRALRESRRGEGGDFQPGESDDSEETSESDSEDSDNIRGRRRRRGRHSDEDVNSSDASDSGGRKRRGRPKGSKNKFPKERKERKANESKKPRGRPKGWKKPKKKEFDEFGNEIEVSDHDTTAGSTFREGDELKKRFRFSNKQVCNTCERPGKLLLCEADCQRWFHLGCLGLTEAPDPSVIWKCPQCTNKTHPCACCHKERRHPEVRNVIP